jgi:predicted tellurium resistance membrane protein TerC
MSESLPVSGNVPDSAEPRGIGGWLILPIVHLVADVVVLVLAIATGVKKSAASIHATHAAIPPGALFFIIFLLFAVAICAFAIYCLVQLFQKKRDVPYLMTAFYLLVAIKMLVNLGLVRHFPETQTPDAVLASAWRGFLSASAGAVLWISYFHKSVRVRNTFVN